jgi:hypothetical protein
MAFKTREAEILRGNARLPTDASTKSPLQRLFTDPDFTARVVRHLLHLPVRMETEDRRVLENLIFPYYRALPGLRSILFVGCDWYTRHYERAFFRNTDYWTIDLSPRARRFAGRRHVVGPLERLDEFFPEQRFDRHPLQRGVRIRPRRTPAMRARVRALPLAAGGRRTLPARLG